MEKEIIDNLKHKALNDILLSERERAIDLIARIGTPDAIKALAEISRIANGYWEKSRATDHLEKLIMRTANSPTLEP